MSPKRMSVFLTRNAIGLLNSPDYTARPVVQVIDIKTRYTGRVFIVISDGMVAQQVMIRKALIKQMKDKKIIKGSVIHIRDFICNHFDFGSMIFISQMDCVVSDCHMIGSPNLTGRIWVPIDNLAAAIPSRTISNLDDVKLEDTFWTGNPGTYTDSNAPEGGF